jgi:uncharacterized membrane protein
MTYAYVLLGVGVVLTLAGFFGPQDEGMLELLGLVLVGLSIYAAHKLGGFPLPFTEDK